MKTTPPHLPASDRRQLPRIDISLPATLQLESGDSVHVRVVNISPDGMQVQCSRLLAARLCPAEQWNAHRAISLGARFLVPLQDTKVPVKVRCRMRHLNLLPNAPPEAEVAVGLAFRRFECDEHLRRFVAFIEQQLVPAEDYDVYVRGRPSRMKTDTVRRAPSGAAGLTKTSTPSGNS